MLSSLSPPAIAMNNLRIFCILEGESTPFPVTIESDKTVGELKKAIKLEKSNYFTSVDADQLTLWKVSIPINDDDETPILLDNVSDKKKLGPSADLSEVFEEKLPKKRFHIIVQPPPSVQDNAEMARLRKQVSDMEALTSTSVKFQIVDKKSRKNICTWITNTETASLQDLQDLLVGNVEGYASDNIYIHVDKTSFALISDNQLRSILKQAKGQRRLAVSFDDPAKPFSSYIWSDIQALYGFSSPGAIPDFPIVPKSEPLTESENEILQHVIKDCTLKTEAFMFFLSEASKSTIVDAFMVGAMHFHKEDMLLAKEYPMSGRRGNGPVDFAVMDRPSQSQILGVTEVKKEDRVQGLAQNLAQLDVAASGAKRKRDSADEGRVRPSKAYGIVTDTIEWYFVECRIDEFENVKFRGRRVLEALRLRSGEQALREDCTTIFRNILALFQLMQTEATNRVRGSSNSTAPPSPNKRFAAGDRTTPSPIPGYSL
ncbi:hypothetical protein B0O80DRAFT_466017 [Mortierella sp. GBAus27b]|nr:hypothetical protein B0O80DRAFT_466017 [Mortierella sp. GBAus27b]